MIKTGVLDDMTSNPYALFRSETHCWYEDLIVNRAMPTIWEMVYTETDSGQDDI